MDTSNTGGFIHLINFSIGDAEWVGAALAFLTCIPEVLLSNLDWDIDYSGWIIFVHFLSRNRQFPRYCLDQATIAFFWDFPSSLPTSNLIIRQLEMLTLSVNNPRRNKFVAAIGLEFGALDHQDRLHDPTYILPGRDWVHFHYSLIWTCGPQPLVKCYLAKETQSAWRKILPHFHCVHHKSHMGCPGTEAGSSST